MNTKHNYVMIDIFNYKLCVERERKKLFFSCSNLCLLSSNVKKMYIYTFIFDIWNDTRICICLDGHNVQLKSFHARITANNGY